MCARYSLGKTDRLDWGKFGVYKVPALVPRWNVAPGTDVLVIRDVREKGREATTSIKWGLIPYWAKDPKVAHQHINARAETAHEKSAFEGAFKTRRCLLPADGFFEWQTVPGQKRRLPWRAEPADGGILALGGLWDRWKSPEGELVETCTILTVPPNRALAPIHDRMPVLIAPADYERWISEETPLAEARALCAPAGDEELRAFRVSFAVNSSENDEEAVVHPLREEGR